MKIIGLDISHASTGYCVLHCESQTDWRIIENDVYCAGPKEHFEPMSLNRYCDWLDGLILLHRPDAVSIEELNTFEHPSSLRTLAYYHGVTMCLLNQYNVQYYFYSVSEWKSVLGVKDTPAIKLIPTKEKRKEARKELYVEAVEKHFGLVYNRTDNVRMAGGSKKKVYQDRAASLGIANALLKDLEFNGNKAQDSA